MIEGPERSEFDPQNAYEDVKKLRENETVVGTAASVITDPKQIETLT
jgi:hypothetical protein